MNVVHMHAGKTHPYHKKTSASLKNAVCIEDLPSHLYLLLSFNIISLNCVWLSVCMCMNMPVIPVFGTQKQED